MNIVVIVTYFAGRDMLSLFINDFILCVAIIKCVVLIFVHALYKSPLLLLLFRFHSSTSFLFQSSFTHLRMAGTKDPCMTSNVCLDFVAR